MELVAESPAVRHPSVVCAAPDGRVFVAEDPMDISAPADAKLGRIICFHPDGRRTVFVEGLHAVFGLQYLEGKIYALHNPHFSAFVDGGDAAGAREELVESTNPNPWALEWNDHVPANFKLAMDGFFYIAVGDKGLYQAKGRDGRVVNLHGGGIARIRPDGTGFEVVCTGVRNILDVALNDEDEMFTYDNTDEHNWMGRLTHMVEGGFYGYPYDFQPRRPYTLWMMADYGPGAACGTICATEGGLPAEYNNDLFLADFGKRQIMRVKVRRAGATYEEVFKQDLFPNPPEDFRPVGICWAPNGRDIYVCDWQHRDVKADKQVGRLWKLMYTGDSPKVERPEWYVPLATGKPTEAPVDRIIAALDDPSRNVRLSAQRTLSGIVGAIFKSTAPDIETRRATNKALSDVRQLLSKVISSESASARSKVHALWAALDVHFASGDRDKALRDSSPFVRRQVARWLVHNDLGDKMTLHDMDAGVRFWGVTSRVDPFSTLADPDAVVRHATIQGLNHLLSKESEVVDGRGFALFLNNENAFIRDGIAYALRGVYSTPLLDGLDALIQLPESQARGSEWALQLIADMHHKLPEWKGEWWAYHPALAPAPRKTVVWEGTERVKEILLKHVDSRKELAVIAIRGIGEARFMEGAERIRRALERTRDREVETAAVNAIAELKPEWAGGVLRKYAAKNAAAFDGLVAVGGKEAEEFLRGKLASSDLVARKRAIAAAGKLRSKALVEPLVGLAKGETRVEATSALVEIPDARALEVYLAALEDRNATLRDAAKRALRGIADEAWAVLREWESFSAEQAKELRQVYVKNAEAVALIAARAKAAVEIPVEEYLKAAADGRGDAARGAAIFRDEQGVACAKCHRVGAEGGSIGPDLTTAGRQFGRNDLIESVLFPSKVIREGNQQMEIETTDDESFAGLSKGETATEYRLLNANGELRSIPKAKVKSTRLSNTSMMPEGLHSALKPDDFADLIAYLESLK